MAQASHISFPSGEEVGINIIVTSVNITVSTHPKEDKPVLRR